LPDWPCAVSRTPSRWRAPPFLGMYHPLTQQLRGRAAGTLARWSEVALDCDALYEALAAELLVWVKLGWPPQLLRQAWSRPGRDPRVPVLARRILQDLGDSGVRRLTAAPWPWSRPAGPPVQHPDTDAARR
jgi:hypothetical protein